MNHTQKSKMPQMIIAPAILPRRRDIGDVWRLITARATRVPAARSCTNGRIGTLQMMSPHQLNSKRNTKHDLNRVSVMKSGLAILHNNKHHCPITMYILF